jgi:hypothetical protein
MSQKQEVKINLASATKGASIAYILADTPQENLDLHSGWQVFHEAIPVKNGQYLYAMAQRIGFRESDIITEIIK